MEREIKILKIQRKPQRRGYQVTVPKEIAEDLGLKGGERVKALLDKEGRRIVYQLL